jgi:hypothetical protein
MSRALSSVSNISMVDDNQIQTNLVSDNNFQQTYSQLYDITLDLASGATDVAVPLPAGGVDFLAIYSVRDDVQFREVLTDGLRTAKAVGGMQNAGGWTALLLTSVLPALPANKTEVRIIVGKI